MIRWIRDWLAGRRAREERRAYSEGYRWAKDAIAVNVPVGYIRGVTCGVFGTDEWDRAFDRGANSACDDHEAAARSRRLDALSGSSINRMD